MRHVWISEAASDAIIRVAMAARPNETGGVLIGVEARGRPWIVDAPEVASTDSSPIRYALDGTSRQAVVDEARRTDERVGYVGEWHSHPADVAPSRLDLRSLGRLATDPHAECPHPLLIVVRCGDERPTLDCREWVKCRATKMRLIATGQLPPNEQ